MFHSQKPEDVEMCAVLARSIQRLDVERRQEAPRVIAGVAAGENIEVELVGVELRVEITHGAENF